MADPFEVSVRCLYVGCKAAGSTRLTPDAGHNGYSVQPDDGWLHYALGYPTPAPNLGVCREHQRVTLDGEPRVEVHVTQETHGLYYALSIQCASLGRVTFPTNTETLQVDHSAPALTPPESAKLWAAGRRVAAQYGFKAPPHE